MDTYQTVLKNINSRKIRSFSSQVSHYNYNKEDKLLQHTLSKHSTLLHQNRIIETASIFVLTFGKWQPTFN